MIIRCTYDGNGNIHTFLQFIQKQTPKPRKKRSFTINDMLNLSKREQKLHVKFSCSGRCRNLPKMGLKRKHIHKMQKTRSEIAKVKDIERTEKNES